MQNKLSISLMLIFSIFLIGCGNDIVFDNTPDSNGTDGEIKPPSVNAGVDKTTTVFSTIEIVGTVTAGDGQIVGYEWRESLQLLSGLKSFAYTPSTEGNHTLTLTVVDENDKKASDSMIVIVTAEANTSK
jgi:hypothetical protein